MYLVEHDMRYVNNPMLFTDFEEAIAFVKLAIACGRSCTVKKVIVRTKIEKNGEAK